MSVVGLLIKIKFLYMEPKITFDTIDSIINEAQKGNAFIIVDDEHRENEGDIIASAAFITPKLINVMKEAGGLICVAIDHEVFNRFALELHPRRNIEASETAFTLSVDAVSNIQTGISSEDRAYTIKKLADPLGNPKDFKSPGHIFPVLAHKNGINERRGHTEASIEIAKLAKLPGAMVMCEIINKNGTMSRGIELHKFAQDYKMKISTVDLLHRYIQKNG